MPLSSFCGLTTLEVGVSIVATIYFTIVAIMVAVNIFEFSGMHLHFILMLIFAIGLLVAGVCLFISAYNEEKTPAMVALVVTAILICYWLVLCFSSFTGGPSQVRSVCIYYRCPESFWIVNLNRTARDDGSGEKDYPADNLSRTQDDDESSGKSGVIKKGANVTTYVDITQYGAPYEIKNPYFYPPYTQHKDKKSGFVDSGVEHQFRLKRAPGTIKNVTFEKQNRPKSAIATSTNMTKKKWDLQSIRRYASDGNSSYVNGSRSTDSKDVEPLLSGTDNTSKWAQHGDENTFYELKDTKEDEDVTFPDTESEDNSESVGFGSILLFAINLIFLIFSAFVIWSWISELAEWDDYDDEEEFSDGEQR